ncbi:unnamed protein product [Cyberlindnera jadinii]|uniref:Small ribosomal subunit protein bS18m n=2 Tax=Cyberlindnera jadinii (strain ATCC 18201 / CBS 1600 / BCRC 20928 / JCM 3617 / NBRC 0987 / NRRL Y-1542) TaxID=983966 RepID=A0A0H5C133_CYBJN|nr:unnamed protein product [Cyberlindnera jadinii]
MFKHCTRLFSTSAARVKSAAKNNGIMGEPLERAPVQSSINIIPSATRSLNADTLYDPFDFSMAKIRLERRKAKENISHKMFDEKKLNPLDFYLETKMLSNYMTSTGRILPREVTKLSVKNQKRLAKSIKRAIAAGLLSSVHQDVSKLTHKN